MEHFSSWQKFNACLCRDYEILFFIAAFLALEPIGNCEKFCVFLAFPDAKKRHPFKSLSLVMSRCKPCNFSCVNSICQHQRDVTLPARQWRYRVCLRWPLPQWRSISIVFISDGCRWIDAIVLRLWRPSRKGNGQNEHSTQKNAHTPVS